MWALILGVIVFSIFVPFVPVARDSLDPPCGGLQYDSVTYYIFGLGWNVAFVSPDAQYGWIAPAAGVLFFAAVGYAVLLIFRGLHASLPSPQI